MRPGMDMEMKMRHLLARCLANRVPDAHALAWECGGHGPSDVGNRSHQCCTSVIVHVADILQMRLWHNQDVTRVELTYVHEGDRRRVLSDEAGRRVPGDDLAEDALACHVVSKRPNA